MTKILLLHLKVVKEVRTKQPQTTVTISLYVTWMSNHLDEIHLLFSLKTHFDVSFFLKNWILFPPCSNKVIINKNYLNIFHQLGISFEFRRIIFTCSQHFACSIVKDLPSFTHTAFNASIVKISEFEQLQKLLTATSSWINSRVNRAPISE